VTTCGVVGVGAIGAGLVESLLRAGFSVSAFDVDAPALQAVAAGGAEPALSPRALAEGADVCLLSLPDSPEILACLGGENGLEAGLRGGSVVIVMSTVAPETPVDLARRLAPLGVEVLDAPVSGGPARAREGRLAIMVGGADEPFERCRPVLEALGEHVVHVGPVGHGELAKLVNNLMGAVIVLGVREGLTLAAKAGADVHRICEAVGGGSGGSWILREWIPETVLRDDYSRRFSIELMCKDLRLIGELAEGLGVPIDACELAQETFARALADGYGDSDFSRVVALHAQAAGAPLP
jgi:3-hydroxyisobutyrate dehydrogenase-like beta-hydroxyacid dehydrogenase